MCHAHGGTEFSIGSCIPSKYMNQGKPSGSSSHQKSLPYRPNHSSLTIHLGSHGLGPWVTKIIPSFCQIFNGFLHTFEHTQGIDVDSSCCISFGLTKILAACPLTKILFFFLYYYYYFFLFSSFWDFGPSWAFMVLLNFMNWAFFC